MGIPSKRHLKPLVEFDKATKKTTLNFHQGQRKAYYSKKRIIAIIAGARSGKTSFGPWWLIKEMKLKGPGVYMVVAPSYKLLDNGAAPEIAYAFCEHSKLGKMTHGVTWQVTITRQGKKALFGDPNAPLTRIIFGHADNPDSLEAVTAKAAWLDEAGQKRFKLGSWEAIRRRLSIDQGRTLITTNPYGMTWLKTEIFDEWQRLKNEGKDHPDIDFINFDSTMNPAFPKEEWADAKARLPPWKFDLYHRGIFTRPAGLIYDCLDPDLNIVADFAIPVHWRRYLGLDFGGVNTAGVFFAKEPETGIYYAYREYHAGGRTAKEHAIELLATERGIPLCVGGAKSEGQWRDEFRAAGLPVKEPDQPLVDVGITRVYGAIKERKIVLFESLARTIDQFESYSREVGEDGEPTEDIEDKETYHFLDAIRYIMGWEFREAKTDWRAIRIDNPLIGTEEDQRYRPQIERGPSQVSVIRQVCS